jgi:Protein of unknown function (DUF1552)
MIQGRQLPRRTFLRGLGATIALPLLDSMVPALARAAGKSAIASPNRMAFIYAANGIIMEQWTPPSEGPVAPLPRELPSILQPIESFRDQLMVLTGLASDPARAHGDGPGDHARSAAAYLTAVHPKKTFGADIQAGVSVDQLVAQKIGHETKFASLELGCEEGLLAGNCDNAYSCAYTNTISWRTPSSPLPPEVNPRAAFERLFGSGDLEQDPVRRAREQKYDKSILDFVMEDARRLQGELGATDRRKLDEYLFSVRDIEKRIVSVERQSDAVPPDMPKPGRSVPEDFTVHSRLMLDLLAVAFQADLTRVSTLMFGLEQSNRNFREIDIPDSHHGLTHHRGDPEKIAKLVRINHYQMEQFAYFLQKLRSIQDGDGTLLDHSMVVYGSSLADANRHQHDNLPAILAGGAGGLRPAGQHVRYPDETPMANLFVAMADKMGAPIESFGDSRGDLGYLSEI